MGHAMPGDGDGAWDRDRGGMMMMKEQAALRSPVGSLGGWRRRSCFLAIIVIIIILVRWAPAWVHGSKIRQKVFSDGQS